MQVKDKVVIITGAGSGIGAATAKLFGQHQSKIIVSDINLKKANIVANSIQKSGGSAIALQSDVASYDSVKNLINQTVEHFGRLDVIINNAGIGPEQLVKTAQHTLEDWDNVIRVNQTGVFYCMQLALQQMLKQGAGNIVNVASLAGLKPSQNNLCYAASKYAVVGMTKSAALEYANKNIRINAVCPAYTESALLDKLLAAKPGIEANLKSMNPMKRFGKPEEIAEAIVWLASDSTRFVTGETIVLDGGISLL